METIEIKFRTKIAYYHTRDFGTLGYENAEYFNGAHHYRMFLGNLEKGIQQSSKELLLISYSFDTIDFRHCQHSFQPPLLLIRHQ